MEDKTKQQEQFIKFHSEYSGLKINNIEQLQHIRFSGKELFAYITAFNKSFSQPEPSTESESVPSAEEYLNQNILKRLSRGKD